MAFLMLSTALRRVHHGVNDVLARLIAQGHIGFDFVRDCLSSSSFSARASQELACFNFRLPTGLRLSKTGTLGSGGCVLASGLRSPVVDHHQADQQLYLKDRRPIKACFFRYEGHKATYRHRSCDPFWTDPVDCYEPSRLLVPERPRCRPIKPPTRLSLKRSAAPSLMSLHECTCGVSEFVEESTHSTKAVRCYHPVSSHPQPDLHSHR